MGDNHKKMVTGWKSPIAVHPGKFLEETLEDFSMSQADLSARLGMSKKVVNEIIKGKNPLTRSTAFKLSKIFPLSEEYWINLQQIFEDDKARLEEEKRISEEIKQYLPEFRETYKELSRIEVTQGSSWNQKNFPEITLELQKFYGVDSLAYIKNETMEVSYRKYDRKNLNQYTLAAWLRLGRLKAQKTEVNCFDAKLLKDNIQNLASLSEENPNEYLPKLERILAECGIVLACMPYLKNTHVQGAATWINKDKALVMVNTSKKSEDKFWFNLFHELGHILKHSKKESFVDLENFDIVNNEEKEADEFAQQSLIPDFTKVVSEFNKYRNHKEAIHLIARQIKISPAILAGRIAHELEDQGRNVYGLFNGFWETRINYTNL